MGDFNAKRQDWGCHSNNKRRNLLATFTAYSHQDIMVHHPTSPTHFGYGRPDILDLAITKNIPQNLQIEVLCDLESDHNPIVTTYRHCPATKSPKQIKHINWEKFQEYLTL